MLLNQQNGQQQKKYVVEKHREDIFTEGMEGSHFVGKC